MRMNALGSTAPDVVVIGAGVVGTAVAFFAARRGLSVTIVDRGAPASGTSSSGEGNVLISDKELGPELELARYSLDVWRDDLAEFAHLWEFEAKGGIIVASRESSLASLERLVASQRAHGITVERLDGAALREAEPEVTPHALGAAYYPDDCQVQPMLVAAHLARMAREHGADLVTGATVTGLLRRDGAVRGVRTTAGDLHCGAVVNAAGPWAAEIAALAGVRLPVEPRRGFVLVTEPLPPTVRHKVYAAEYVDNVGSSDAGLQASAVVEGTPGGTVLIGSTRERVGFDRTPSAEALQVLARNAVALFPFLADVRALRHYHGFRPYSPDHLPAIGPDPRAPGLWHACGHEGAGIGLSVGTGKLLAAALAGEMTDLRLDPFAPQRFDDDGGR
ncbi:glycine/D-amino acid oxidase, deaminating [Saccharomonospora xinjiangensis XJ-54]|uniref:Glycine/D-amino acid oxidase, deaminating n=2 Tax=Saccharomonospora TaxID=1851 RepID=I0UYU4_9PSEU|nr:glycine/D-amino acid oxidase, deaminating [Saccharomonospora xinjiangensis XJ-54]